MSQSRLVSVLAVALICARVEAQTTLRARSVPESQYVTLGWNHVAGASSYLVQRATVFPGWDPGTNVGYTNTVTLTLTANGAYLYRVVPLDAQSHPIGTGSNSALVTSYAFTDQPLIVDGTLFYARHVTELRTMVNAARTSAGLSSYAWSYPIGGAGSAMHKEDIIDLRAALDAVFPTIGLQPSAWVDSPLTTSVGMKKEHLDQIRSRVRNFPELISGSATVSNRYFSPNGDGQKDTTTFSATISRIFSTRWTVNVRNAGSTIVRTATGIGNAPLYVWDGRNSGGAFVPEGDYSFELLDSEDPGYTIAGAVTTIDLTPPVATIDSPTSGQTISNVRQSGSGDVNVTGQATDTRLSSWDLEVTGNGVTNGINSGTSPTGPGAALGVWRTLSPAGYAANGPYTLRLTANDLAGNTRVATVPIVVGNFTAAQTVHQLNVVAGETVSITSTVPFPINELLTIRNAQGQVVRTLVNQQLRSAGTYVDTWNGRSDAGTPVGDGAYKFIAVATEGANTATFDQSGEFVGAGNTQFNYPRCADSTGVFIACSAPTASFFFDPYAAKPLRIQYCVGAGDVPNCSGGQPAYVMVKAVSTVETNATCNGDCIFADYQATGPHEIVWFGRGTTNAFLGNSPYLTVIRAYDMIPKNMTVVYGGGPSLSNLTIVPLEFNPSSAPSITPGQQFRFRADVAAGRTITLSAAFRNTESGSVLRTVTTGSLPGGDQVLSWDGRADNGAWVASGVYEVIITATDSAGGSAQLKPLTIVRY